VVNVVVWRALYERFRRAVIAGRLLRVTGRVERQSGVTHVLAEEIEDISPLLDRLTDPSPLSQARKTG
jgi:DNA-directed RNA polymerase